MSLFCSYFLRGAGPLMVVAALAACERQEARVYVEPKERIQAEPAEDPHAGHDHSKDPHDAHEPQAPAMPKVTWTLPAGWKDLGGNEMNVARFDVAGAMINVVPLAGMEGREAQLVNMWRGVFKMPTVDDAAALQALQDIPIAGGQGKIFDLTSAPTEADKTGARIVTAIFHREGVSWFFKLQGPPEVVAGQLEVFKQFLASVRFEAAPANPAPQAPAVAAQPAAPPSLPTPAGWTSVAPGQMQIAKYTVPEVDGAKAEVTVSVFPNDTGGIVANVRRWRGQVGLPEADDAAIQASVKPLEGAPTGSNMVELVNADRALTGAIVPREGSFYFYKLMGGAPAVAAARESFLTFARGQ